MFCFVQAREARTDEYTWPESQDQILVTWPSGEKATLYILVVHAIIILLTYGAHCADRAYLYYDSLLSMWFPVQKELTPKVNSYYFTIYFSSVFCFVTK